MSDKTLSFIKEALSWVSFITGMVIVVIGLVSSIWIGSRLFALALAVFGWAIAIAIPLLINREPKENPN
jgi:hypothetical protein